MARYYGPTLVIAWPPSSSPAVPGALIGGSISHPVTMDTLPMVAERLCPALDPATLPSATWTLSLPADADPDAWADAVAACESAIIAWSPAVAWSDDWALVVERG